MPVIHLIPMYIWTSIIPPYIHNIKGVLIYMLSDSVKLSENIGLSEKFAKTIN